MYNKTFKLLGIIMLMILSFVYTNRVFNLVKEKDPMLIDIKKYKRNADTKPISGLLRDGVLQLGSSGKVVNVNASYENMKDDKVFNKNKIIYDNISPKNTITNNYSYFIKRGNSNNKYVSIVFKVSSDTNLNNLIYISSKHNITPNLFVDGKYLLNNFDYFLSVKYPIYNAGYDNEYNSKTLKVTNNLIDSILNNRSVYCLNEEKSVVDLKICEKKKMYSISPELVNPRISDIKNNLKNGLIIMYDLDTFDIDTYSYIIKVFRSKNYKIVDLKYNINE